jgi:endonuclease III
MSRHQSHIAIIAKELKNAYDDFNHFNRTNPLDELLFILCSLRRTERVYRRAFKSLKQAYPTYDELAQASVGELSSKILWGGLQNKKSRDLHNIMNAITSKFGKPSLAPLRKMSEAECEEFLCSLPGVGKKVARCVMLFSLAMSVFPVDTHCWRISKRLGWLESGGRQGSCSLRDMDNLQKMIPPKLRLSLHVNMVSLGRDTCLARTPKCGNCIIMKYCPKITD